MKNIISTVAVIAWSIGLINLFIYLFLVSGKSPEKPVTSDMYFGNCHLKQMQTIYVNVDEDTIKMYATVTAKPEGEPEDVQRLIDHPKRPVTEGWYTYTRWAAILLSHPELSYPDFIDPNGQAGFLKSNLQLANKGTVPFSRTCGSLFFYGEENYTVSLPADKNAVEKIHKYFQGGQQKNHVRQYFLTENNADQIFNLLDVRYVDFTINEKKYEDKKKQIQTDLDNGILPK